MRFMMIIKANADSEAGVMPPPEVFEEMGKFNQELIDAGKMLDGAGLLPSSKGARVHFKGNQTSVTDGPFAETKELIAGYWVIQADSLQEAVDLARRVPNPTGEEGQIEIRQIGEMSDFE
jgi:hypothetical protein